MLVAKKNYYYYDQEPLQIDRKASLEKNKTVKKNTHTKACAVFCVLLISFLLIILLSRYSAISEVKYRIHTLNKQVVNLEKQLQDLKAELDKATRSDIIEQKAIKELNMQYPQYSQMVFLNMNDNNLDLHDIAKNHIIDELDEKQNENNKIYYYLISSIQKLHTLLD